MIEVFLDTNTFYRANFFRSTLAEAVLKGTKFLGITILIPELVIDETKANFKSELKKKLNQYHNNLGKLIDLPDSQTILDEEVVKYNNFLDNFVTEYNVVILPYPETPVKELVEKSYEAKKPFKAKGEGYKDYVIWQTIKDYCDNSLGRRNRFFITSDKDFYEKHSDGTFALHPELIATLEETLKAPKVILSLKDFFDQELKPLLPDVDPKYIPDFNMQETVRSILYEDLPNHSIFHLEGLLFNEALDIISVIGEPYINDHVISKINEDDILIDVNGSIEIQVEGSMPASLFYREDNYDVDHINDEYEMDDEGIMHHWVVLTQTIETDFELTITYSKKGKEISNHTISLPNAIYHGRYK